jgi:alpha-glucoside transport system permease protein
MMKNQDGSSMETAVSSVFLSHASEIFRKTRKNLPRIGNYCLLTFIAIVWAIPTLGLLVSSFRAADAVTESGWWTILQNPNGARLTLDNYLIVTGNGNSPLVQGQVVFDEKNIDVLQPFFNSIMVVIPATIFPILLAAIAAYGFSWMNFPGRKHLFILFLGIQVVPLQVALIPVLRDFNTIGINNTFLAVWIAHTGFGLPLATFLMFNSISGIPKEYIEAARMDGATHLNIFLNVVVPLSAPAFASFAILQFLWVWNDLLVALVFLGFNKSAIVMTQALVSLSGTYGNRWHLLTAGAFISMIIPLVIFFSLQRYFIRGLVSGGIKG